MLATVQERTYIFVGVRELDLAVDTSRTKESRVKDIDAVGRHDDLDVLRRLEAIELVQQLEHRTLYLAISSLKTVREAVVA